MGDEYQEEREENDWDKILFPEKIRASRIERMFSYLAEDLKVEVEYTLKNSYRIGYRHITKDKIKGKESINAESSGTIRFNENYRWLNFILKGDSERGTRNFFYTAMQFDTTPGESAEYRKRSPTQNPDDMEKVKKSLEKYFSDTETK